MSEVIKIHSGKLVGIKTSVFTIFNEENYDPAVIPDAWQAFFSKAQSTDLLNQEKFLVHQFLICLPMYRWITTLVRLLI